MSQTFAQVVERVKQLSLDEKEELLELLSALLIEGTGQEVKVHGVASEMKKRQGEKKLDPVELVSRMPDEYEVPEEGFSEPVGKEEW